MSSFVPSDGPVVTCNADDQIAEAVATADETLMGGELVHGEL